MPILGGRQLAEIVNLGGGACPSGCSVPGWYGCPVLWPSECFILHLRFIVGIIMIVMYFTC